MRRGAIGPLLALPAALGCYQPQTLDARAVYDEIARESTSHPAGAVPPPPAGVAPDRALTEIEAVAIALRWNPDLRAARLQRGIAEGELVAASALSNPTVSFDLLHIEEYDRRHAWAVELGWTPPQPGIYSAGRAVARAEGRAVEADVAEAEWQLAVSVRGAHASLLALEEQAVLLDKAREARLRLRDLVNKRVNGGASTRLDLSLAGLALSEVELARDQLAAEVARARSELGRLLGVTRAQRAAGAIPDPSGDPPPADTLFDLTLASRPALRAAEMRFAENEQSIRLEYARAWPWFRLTAIPRYHHDETDPHPHDFSAGIELTVPVLNQNGGPVQIAKATRDQRREQMKSLVESVRLQLLAARDQIDLRKKTLARYRTGVMPELEAHERMLSLALGGGQLDLVALLTAEDVILRDRREFVGVRLAHYQAWLALESAVGRRVEWVARAP